MIHAPPARQPYTCPCCGHLVFDEPPGSHAVCPVCFWEDDALQLEFATTPAGGANGPTLLEAKRNYYRFGACEERFRRRVRPPLETSRGTRPGAPSIRRRIRFPLSGLPVHPDRGATGSGSPTGARLSGASPRRAPEPGRPIATRTGDDENPWAC